jgi:hypothetical protein
MSNFQLGGVLVLGNRREKVTTKGEYVAEKEGKNKEMAKTTVENKKKVKRGHRHETTDGSLHPQLGLTLRRDYETPSEDGFCSHFAESCNLSTIW